MHLPFYADPNRDDLIVWWKLRALQLAEHDNDIAQRFKFCLRQRRCSAVTLTIAE
jgi:hypothetical protein